MVSADEKELTCNSCQGDSGSGDDVTWCNAWQVSLPCSVKVSNNIGTTHCYTFAGRYKFLNGSQDILTGIARGCIDCSGKNSENVIGYIACTVACNRLTTFFRFFFFNPPRNDFDSRENSGKYKTITKRNHFALRNFFRRYLLNL